MVFDSMKQSLDTIATFCDYLIHPSKIAWAIWHLTVSASYLICIMICLAGLFLNILGFKKYTKLAPASVVFYTIIQSINSWLVGLP